MQKEKKTRKEMICENRKRRREQGCLGERKEKLGKRGQSYPGFGMEEGKGRSAGTRGRKARVGEGGT